MASFRVALRGKSVNIIYQHNRSVPIPIHLKVNCTEITDKEGKWIKGDDHANIIIQKRINELRDYVNQHFMDHKAYPVAQKMSGFFRLNKVSADSLESVWIRFVYEKTHAGAKSVSIGRMKHYNTFKDILLKFKPNLKLSDINLRFYNQFSEWMIHHQNYNANTLSAKINVLKTFMNWCIDSETYIFETKLMNAINYKKHHNDTFFHSAEELYTMVTTNIDDEYLAAARDMYCLQCMTGIRYSDLLSHKWIHESDYLKKVSVKTGEEIIVPLRKAAKDIIERLNRNNTTVTSNQHYNSQIKEVGRICGIKQDVLIIKGKRKFKPGDIVPKYKLMSSHMARATFICQMIDLDIQDQKIMKMTGIRKQDTLAHYSEVIDKSLKDTMQKVQDMQGF